MSLIPDEKMATLRDSGPWDDEDVCFLGNGRKATYDARRRLFVVEEGGKVLGEVPLKAVTSRGGRR
jgi:hypothetical protein